MEPKQLFWHHGQLYMVTGFNQSMPAATSSLARQMADRWKTQFELAQLLLRCGYVMQKR
jgi:hypothetical protein